MANKSMVSFPLRTQAPCPDCGLAWQTPGSRHMKRAPAGSVCGVDGCKKRPLTECFVNGKRVAVWCVGGGHRWRRPAD